MNKLVFAISLLIVVAGSSCSRKMSAVKTAPSSVTLVDAAATPETKALFANLKQLSKAHTLFGHQHATEYGHGWAGDADRSDVKSVTGSHPAVIGVDLSGFTGHSPEDGFRSATSVETLNKLIQANQAFAKQSQDRSAGTLIAS